MVRIRTGISGPLDPEYKWHYLAEIWQKPGDGEAWMATLDRDEFARNLVDAKTPAAGAVPSVQAAKSLLGASALESGWW